MKALDKIAELDRRRVQLINDQDYTALPEVFAEDLVHVHATGECHDRATLIAHMARHPRRIASRQPNIRVYGDTAILTGEQVNIGNDGEQTRLFVTQVVRLAQGQWVFVSFHSCRMTAS